MHSVLVTLPSDVAYHMFLKESAANRDVFSRCIREINSALEQNITQIHLPWLTAYRLYGSAISAVLMEYQSVGWNVRATTKSLRLGVVFVFTIPELEEA